MTEPDWSKAPEWARWWAMDEDGWAFWFESEPFQSTDLCQWEYTAGRCVSCDTDYPDWRESLRERP